MVDEQKFKDFLSSTCQVSVESIVLDLESEIMKGPGSIPTGNNILSQDFFHIVKPPMSILALLPLLCVFENPECNIKTHHFPFPVLFPVPCSVNKPLHRDNYWGQGL